MKKQIKLFSIINLILCLAMLIINGVAGSKGLFGNTVGEISDSIPNQFTPAGYAFSIWSVIFLSQIILSVSLVIKAFKNEASSFAKQINLYSLLHILNIGWIFCWHSLQFGLSVLVMLALLFVLSKIYLLNKKQLKPNTNLLNWSTHLYYGWITVATVANITAFLVHQNVNLSLTKGTWAAIMVAIATLIYLTMTLKEKAYVFTLVGVWSLIAIAVKQNDGNITVFYTAVISASILLIAIISKTYTVAQR